MNNYSVNLEGVRNRRSSTQRRQHVATMEKVQIESIPLPQIYSTDEAAAYLGLSREAVMYRLNKGLLPGKKHLGRWTIRAIDLAKFVEPNNKANN